MIARLVPLLWLLHLVLAPAPVQADGGSVCPGLAPVGEIAVHDGQRAWLASPRDSYRHGVFGEAREPGALVLQGPAAAAAGLDCLVAVLPDGRVFEDRQVRFWDADGDGDVELAVVEAGLEDGGRLALYGLAGGGLRRLAEGPALGFHRWLSPVGPVPWDEGGQPLLAVVTTPHIGGVLRLYRYIPGRPDLVEVARHAGWSTHRFGDSLPGTGLVDAGLVDARQTGSGRSGTGRSGLEGAAWIVLPDQARQRVARLRWQDGSWLVEDLGGTGAVVTGAIGIAPDGCAYRVPTASGTVRLPRPPVGRDSPSPNCRKAE